MIRQELSVEVRQLVPDRVLLPEDQAVLLFQSVRELLINVRKHAGTHQAILTVELSGGDLCITVQDEGAGVDLAGATGANQPSANSSKFGLFSIRERMLAIGGCLEIESSPGRGMTSRLILPLKDMPADKATPPEPAKVQRDGESPILQGTRIRVVLVDDHAMIREGLRGLLYVYDDVTIVGEACDGEEALSLTDKLKPDCVIMDVNMPRMDGIEATRRLKAAFSGTAVIGLSVNASREVEVAMRRAGVDHFLSKEAPIEQIYRTILTAARQLRSSEP
jgi:CheY-like chemotaxis protein